MQKKEAEILAMMMDQTRKLGKFYIGKLHGIKTM